MTASVTPIGGRGQNPPTDGFDYGERLAKLEARLDTMLPALATKGDVAEAKASIVMWLGAIVLASTAIVVSVFAFMLNRAVPVQAPAQQAPIIIYPQTNSPAPQFPPNSKRDR